MSLKKLLQQWQPTPLPTKRPGPPEMKEPRRIESSMFVFLYISVSSTYVSCMYAIPYDYRASSETTILLHRLFCLYSCLMCVGNWYLTRAHTSSFSLDTSLRDYVPQHSMRTQKRLEKVRVQNGHSTSGGDKIQVINRGNGPVKVETVQTENGPVRVQTVITDNGPVLVQKINNLGWTYCDICQRWTPPRCHHCKVCNHCIMKRDHHCFFTGVCIGQKNQRFFIVVLFHTTLALSYWLTFYRYIHSNEHEYQMGWSDHIFPIAWFRAIVTRSMPFHFVHIINFFWFSFMMIPLGPIMLMDHVFHTYKGWTFQEARKFLPIRCTATINQRFRQVFGSYWVLNFIFPMHFWFESEGNGINWPYHYDYKFTTDLADLYKVL